MEIDGLKRSLALMEVQKFLREANIITVKVKLCVTVFVWKRENTPA